LNLGWFPHYDRPVIRVGEQRGSVAHSIAAKEGANMHRDPRKTWQYFAQSVIQEEDPEKLTYLMQELYPP